MSAINRSSGDSEIDQFTAWYKSILGKDEQK